MTQVSLDTSCQNQDECKLHNRKTLLALLENIMKSLLSMQCSSPGHKCSQLLDMMAIQRHNLHVSVPSVARGHEAESNLQSWASPRLYAADGMRQACTYTCSMQISYKTTLHMDIQADNGGCTCKRNVT